MVKLIGADGINGWDGVILGSNGRGGIGGGTVSASASARNTSLSAVYTIATAIGGKGGSGGNGAAAGYDSTGLYWAPGAGGAGAPGGNAYATATGTTTKSAIATATGGQGGSSGRPGAPMLNMPVGAGNNGAVGGFASALATDFNASLFASATSTTTAGAGGAGYGVGKTGGAGGAVASATRVGGAAAGELTAGAAATAIMVQIAGAGGLGLGGANGGAGAGSSATNLVTGYTKNGVLTLSQSTVGGAGGDSDTGIGGKGGSGVSSLTFDDSLNATHSAAILATVSSVGGAGGLGSTAGLAGSAISTLVLTGAGKLSAIASATGGAGDLLSGTANASTSVTGLSGDYSAAASSSLRTGQLVQSVSATAGGGVDGTSTAKAFAGIGDGAATMLTVGQALAFIEGAPSTASVAAVLTANAAIKTAFGAAPVFFGIGELGGGYSAGGVGVQTITTSFKETVNLTKLSLRRDLVVGFYKGTTVGAGFTSMTFDLYADGVDVIHQTFSTAAAAKTYFTNNAIDLGSLATGALSGNTLTLRATMSITTNVAGSGFYGGLIIGDPPASASVRSFTQAMAGMGGQASAVASALMATPHSAGVMLATPSALH